MITVILVVIVLLPSASTSAQPHFEHAAWVTGSVVALGIYDYIGYNLTRDDPTALVLYRISFVVLQSAVTYFLYKKCGLPSAISLNLIWWTFGTDMVYYGVAEAGLPRPSHWSGPGSWRSDSQNGIEHAGWTPVGLFRGENRIPRDTMVAQSLVGAFLGIGISITF